MSAPPSAAILATAQAQLSAARGVNLSDAHVATLMSLSPNAVHVDTALSNFLIAYENREYIADSVLPVLQVSKRSDVIFEFPVDTMQTLAQAQIAGSRAHPNELKYTILHNRNYNVIDYGLRDFVSFDEEANADAPLQPRLAATEILMNALMLARESRVATLAFDSSKYGSNTSALSGTARWDDRTGASDPVQNVLNAIESCFVRPNTFVMGGLVWPQFRNNPGVTKFITGRAATLDGTVPMFVDEAMVAKAFGLERIAVGRAKVNTAREGATVSSGYLWGKSAALIRVEEQPNPRKTSTFGYTYRFGSKAIQNTVVADLMAGVRGGNYVKLTHSDGEYVIGGGNAGYLYTTVIN